MRVDELLSVEVERLVVDELLRVVVVEPLVARGVTVVRVEVVPSVFTRVVVVV